MRRYISWRIATALAVVWLLLPAAVIAQVVHVQPYVQPGDGHALKGTDVKVIHWLTDQTPGTFVVEFFDKGSPIRTVEPARIALDFAKGLPPEKKKEEPKDPAKKDPKAEEDPDEKDDKSDPRAPLPMEKEQHFYRYTAKLDKMPFNSDITYRVKLGDKVIREATFRTRATADKSVRCVLVGDLAQGRKAQKEVAYRISLEKPEFLVALGDIVYPTGRVNQYMAYYWDTYNDVAAAGLKTGAPLMASVPFYPVLGNHDISAKLSEKTPDALGVYLFFSPPKNGPGEGKWNTPVNAKEGGYEKFRAQTADSFPFIDTYSFDNGPAHFVVINTNRPLMEPAFQKWLTDDLQSTKATWKIVCFHIPGFQSSKNHYAEQQVRQLQPIFEKCGVDLTFAGHVHNYQRSVPLKFVPRTPGEEPAKDVKKGKKSLVHGVFTLDKKFDGVKNTRADGVIHIVAGGGGASLYGPELEKTSEFLKKTYDTDNYVDYTARMVVDKQSFVVLDLSPSRLDLRAIGQAGDELDRISLTKGK
jgi:hypothetical protein